MARDKRPPITRRIEAGMAEQGFTKTEMAKACGVSIRTWWNWMHSPETQLSVGMLTVIAAKLNKRPAELLEG